MIKKYKIYIVSAALVVVTLILCLLLYKSFNKPSSDSTSNLPQMNIYYVETDTKLVKPESVTVNGSDEKEILTEILADIKSTPKTETLYCAIPENVKFNSAIVEGRTIKIDFSSEFNDMSQRDKMLCIACVTWTLTELDFVDDVMFGVNGEKITYSNGKTLATLDRESVVIDNDISSQPINYETVVLYFGNGRKNGFVTEVRQIQVNPNQPIERYIVEELIKGTEQGNASSILPSDLKIRDIKTTDGVCYVDLSNEFINKMGTLPNDRFCAVYGIVNSLCELETVNKVQFLVEGERLESDTIAEVDLSLTLEPVYEVYNY